MFKFDSLIIVLLRAVFHIDLVIGPRPAVLAWGAAETPIQQTEDLLLVGQNRDCYEALERLNKLPDNIPPE
jgi:hypothetical protein